MQRLTLNLPEWTSLRKVVPSQSRTSSGNLQDTNDQTPSERGSRRGRSIETLIRNHLVPGRLAVDTHELDRYRTSYRDASKLLEVILSRIIDIEGINSLRTYIECTYKSELVQTKQILNLNWL